MITLNAVFLLAGFGAGLCIGYLIGRAVRRRPEAVKPPESTVYFGSDVYDHPDDIERQVEGSAFVPAPGVGAYVGRRFEHRYDGIADRDPKG